MIRRRDFLQGLSGLGGASLFRTTTGFSILHTLVHGLFTKALAESSGALPRTYLDFHIAGGWPGQFLYAPLKPYAGDAANFIANQQIANNWVSGAPVYSTVSKTAGGSTLNLPPAWGPNLPRYQMASNDSAEVLKHTIFLRGVKNIFNSHELGYEHSYRPGTGLSIAGAVADATNLTINPIPAASFGAAPVQFFLSKKYGTRSISYGGSGPLFNLLSPFDAEAEMEALLSKRDNFTQAFNAAVQAVAQDASAVRPGSLDILASIAGAETLVRENFAGLVGEYNQRLARYQDVISQVSGATGINQVIAEAISPAANDPRRRVANPNATPLLATNADLRSIITASTSTSELARAFATADYLVEFGRTNAASFLLFGATGLNVQTATGTQTDHGNDQHDTGVAVSIPINNFISRSILACLNEFIARAKSWNKFDNVVMNFRSDFTRSPRSDGTGMDHAWDANAMLLVSGAVKVPQVIGNIYGGALAGTYMGTYGVAAGNNHEGDSNTIITMGHYASTVCSLLRVKSPTENFETLVYEDASSGFLSKIGNGIIKPGAG